MQRHILIPPTLARAAGFTLLEALIALVVLSVGLLGLAALQARSMQYNHDALVRSQATAVAQDMVERIRSRRYALAGAQVPTVLNGYVNTYTGTVDPEACDPAVNTVAGEIACWRNSLGALPGGTAVEGRITRTLNGGAPDDDVYTVAVRWRERRTDAFTPPLSLSFQP